jgi:hypothetical protein
MLAPADPLARSLLNGNWRAMPADEERPASDTGGMDGIEMATLKNWRTKVRSLNTAGSKLRKLKLRRLKMRRMEMKTKTANALGRTATTAFLMLALFAGALVPAFAQTRRRPALRRRTPVRRVVKPIVEPAVVYYNVSAGQVIRVRMNQSITSETARIGDQFVTTVLVPIYANGVEVVPAGSEITGRVTSVERASRKSKAGTMGVHFVSLRLPTGIVRAINGDLTDVTADNVNADNEGEVSGRSATRRNVVFIGGGAATGALIGAIAGGGKGAGIGAGVGAGLGVAGAYFSKGHEAVVKAGTEFGVVLNQTVSLPAANVR